VQQRHRKYRCQQWILFFCILIWITESSAQESLSSGGYVGLKAGMTEHKHSCAEAAVECDRSGTGLGIFAGYDFDSRYALELSVAEIGESSAEYADLNLEAALSAADLSIKYSRQLYGNSLWFAKLGVAYWQGEVEGWGVKLDDSGFRPALGLGSELLLSRRFSARIEYQYFSDLGNNEMGHTDSHVLNLGIVWHFAARKPGFEAATPVSAEPVHMSSPPPPASSPPTPVLPSVTEEEIAATVDTAAESKPTIVINDQIARPLFKADSTVLQNTRALEPVAIHLIRQPDLLVRIVTHTDDAGSNEHNKQLSQKRAETVAAFLRWQGVAAERITAEGRGEDMPVADSSDYTGRARNRRVEFFFTDTQIRRKPEGE
jgi:OOP family OmpA-OmpF porin